MEVSKCLKMLEFQKNSIKMKNCKTFYETQTASYLKEIIQPPQPTLPSDKILLCFWKILIRRYTEIYRHLLSKCFNNAVLWRQEMMLPKCFFWNQTETFVKCCKVWNCWEICKVKKLFDCAAVAHYFQCQVSWGS